MPGKTAQSWATVVRYETRDLGRKAAEHKAHRMVEPPAFLAPPFRNSFLCRDHTLLAQNISLSIGVGN
jgi:hypothetical protein